MHLPIQRDRKETENGGGIMSILNEYTKVAYSEGWIFFGTVFVLLLVITLIATLRILFDRYCENSTALLMIMLTIFFGVCVYGSFTIANKGEEHYIQCIIEDDYPASELMKYEI